MIPLSTLIKVLKEYRTEGFDENNPPFYDEHMLAAYIVTVVFDKLQDERMPQPAVLLAGSTLIQSWLDQDGSRWCTSYKSTLGFTTELMNGDKSMAASGEGSTLAESLIKVAEDLTL